MRKAIWLVLLAPLIAFGNVSKLDVSSKSVTLGSNGTACTAAGGASCTVIGVCSAITRNGLCVTATSTWDISGFSNVALTVRNSGATNVLTNVLVEMSDDGTNWEVWDSTTFASLGTTTAKSMQISGNSRHYMRVEGRSASGTTTVVTLVANDG